MAAQNNRQGSFEVFRFVFVVVVMLWSSMLFMSPWLLLFVPFLAGILSRFAMPERSLSFRLLLVLVICGCFGGLYGLASRPSAQAALPFYSDVLDGNIASGVKANLQALKIVPLMALLSAFLGGVIGEALPGGKKSPAIIALVFLTLFSVNFFTSSLKMSTTNFFESIGVLPPGSYTFDGHVYTNAFHHMKSGVPYYQAIHRALSERQGNAPIRSVLNIRPPFPFFLWMLLPPDGSFIALLFFVMASLLFFASYFTMARLTNDPVLSLATPSMLGYLFVYAISAGWFTISEYWAWFFLAAALWARSRGLRVLFVLSFTFCLFTRELFFLPLILFLLDGLLRKDKREIGDCLIILTLSTVYYLTHFYLAWRHSLAGASSLPPFTLGHWLQGGTDFALGSYLFGSIFIFKPLLYGAVILILYAVAAVRIFRERLTPFYPLAALPLAGLAFFFAGVSGLYYWGLLYLPALAYVVPAAFIQPPGPDGEVN
jgi:hypothetical protein